jgi:hypothetical protein
MKWTVVYRPSAQDDLASLWLDASDRTAVAAAADEIDRQLARDPLTAGESRDGWTRILCELPLAVLFEVLPDDHIATVLAVFRWRSQDSA